MKYPGREQGLPPGKGRKVISINILIRQVVLVKTRVSCVSNYY